MLASGNEPELSSAADLVPENVVYWLKGESVQNFGDFLAAFFMHRLFVPELVPAAAIYLIGSALADFTLLPVPTPGRVTSSSRMIYWGCGLRAEASLRDGRHPAVEILSVRGPLTRSLLCLGQSVPFGDPGLLLPILHRAPDCAPRGTVIVPHFHDRRPDAALLEISGCECVLRPNLPNDVGAIEEFLDSLLRAEFALCGSLHAAIARAAYGRPFAYWDSGSVDLPFKWQDFSASVGIPCQFEARIERAREQWEAEIAPSLTLPPLSPLLAAAPFPVQPDAFLRTVAWDIDRLGPSAAQTPPPIHVSRRFAAYRWDHARALVRERDAALRERDGGTERLKEALAAEASASAQLRRHRAEDAAQFRQEATRFREQAERFSHELAILRSERDDTWSHVAQLDRRISEQAAHEQHLLKLLAQRAEDWERVHHVLEARTREAAQWEAVYAEVTNSPAWRLVRPLREIGSNGPAGASPVRRAARAAAVLAKGELPDRIRRRHRKQAEIDALRASPLFDAAFYIAQHPGMEPGADAAAHYALVGAYSGAMPNPYFDSRWYLSRYPEVAREGENPLLHWLRTGLAAGCKPNPIFDTDWYCRRYPDVAASGLDPISHWIARGAAELRDPNPMLDARAVLPGIPGGARKRARSDAALVAARQRRRPQPASLI